MAAASPHISLAAENIGSLGGVFPVSNALLTTWLVMAVLVLLSIIATKNLKTKPGRGQMITELIVGGLFSFFSNLGGKHGKKFAPLAVTLFLFIVMSNWAGLLPGVGTIGFFEKGAHATTIVSQVTAATENVQDSESVVPAADSHSEAEVVGTATDEHAEEGKDEKGAEAHTKFVPLFRGPTADLNLTIALGLIAFAAIQYFGFTLGGGINYIKKFIDLRSPIYFFVGILEIISDISKIISFAFRLFGNIFAGEVLLTVMAFLPVALIGVPPLLLPIPFYLLELFVGVIQGLVFAMLTTVFLNVAVSHGDHGSHDGHDENTAHKDH